MTWQDRQYKRDSGAGGRAREILRRIFGEGENPLTWGVPLYRAFGIEVRLHLLFLLWIIATLIWSIPQRNLGLPYMALGVGSLFVIVLLHEYGHCFWCRKVGGEADRIMLWPLGGLAHCRPPHAWRAELITVLGGPAVHLMLWPVLASALWAIVGLDQIHSALIFNPLAPGEALAGLRTRTGEHAYLLVWVWWMYYINAILFLFNMLVPMYPLDGGRVLQCLIWRRRGHDDARRIAATVGLVTAFALATLAIVGRGHTTLLAIAIFGGITCWLERRHLQFEHSAGTAGSATPGGYDFSRGYAGLPDPAEEDVPFRPSRADLRKAKKAAETQAEVDRILDKIRAMGMDALTSRERKFLADETRRRRKSARGRANGAAEP